MCTLTKESVFGYSYFEDGRGYNSTHKPPCLQTLRRRYICQEKRTKLMNFTEHWTLTTKI